MTALVLLAVLWILTIGVCALWAVSCCLCCFPSRLRRCLAFLAVLLVVVSILVTAALTHRLQELLSGTQSVVVKSFRVARVLVANER